MNGSTSGYVAMIGDSFEDLMKGGWRLCEDGVKRD
jgi:hypothetical protein